MGFRIRKSLAVIAICFTLLGPTGTLAQAVISQPAYTDTTQMLMRQKQQNIISQQRLLDRQNLVRRFSADCRPGQESVSEKCRREIESTKEQPKQEALRNDARAVSSSSAATQSAPASAAAAGATGGVSIGAGTLVASGFVLLFGRYVFSLFSSDSSSSGDASVASADSTSE